MVPFIRINLSKISVIVGIVVFFGILYPLLLVPHFCSKMIELYSEYDTIKFAVVYKLFIYKRTFGKFPLKMEDAVAFVPEGFPYSYHTTAKGSEFNLVFNDDLFLEKKRFDIYRILSWWGSFPQFYSVYSKDEKENGYEMILNELSKDSDIIFVKNTIVYVKYNTYSAKRDYYQEKEKKLSEKKALYKGNLSVFIKGFHPSDKKYQDVMRIVQ